MRVTLLGHASVLVELSGRTIVIDPVFSDSFAEGALVACPARRIYRERIPRIDATILTQRDPDHFDIASLATLPRDRLVVCPKDPFINHVLERLGFTNVRAVDVNSLLKMGVCELLTTPSSRNGVEFGVVLKDPTGSFWHQVDSAPTSEMVQHVRALVGSVDLLFASYAPQDFAYFGSQRGGYPAGAVRATIERIRQAGPRLVVPASAGLRFADPHGWVNSFAFPVSRGGFTAQMERVAPGLAYAIGNPGDIFDVVNRSVSHRPGASRMARMVADDTHLTAFDPTAEVPPLTDPNVDGYSSEVLEQQVEETLTGLCEFARDAYARGEQVLTDLRERNSSYGVGVVFPNGTEWWVKVEFDADGLRVTRGTGRVRHTVTTHRTAASVVTARARGDRAYYVTAGLSRLSLVSPASLVGDRVVIDPHEPRDLLVHYLDHGTGDGDPQWKRLLDRCLEPFCRPPNGC